MLLTLFTTADETITSYMLPITTAIQLVQFSNCRLSSRTHVLRELIFSDSFHTDIAPFGDTGFSFHINHDVKASVLVSFSNRGIFFLNVLQISRWANSIHSCFFYFVLN